MAYRTPRSNAPGDVQLLSITLISHCLGNDEHQHRLMTPSYYSSARCYMTLHNISPPEL